MKVRLPSARWAGRALILAGFAALIFLRHRRYVAGLPGYSPPPPEEGQAPLSAVGGLTETERTLLGWTQTSNYRPASSYLDSPAKKPPRATRIGFFGCSFVFGDEVARGKDFPSLLRSRFRRAGYRDVEILNFGVSGYGFHQAFLLWRLLGRRYGLDRAVFMTLPVYDERDRTFLFGETYDRVHARFVLSDGRPELLPPIGRRHSECAREYHSLIPHWRYLRYDVRIPTVLRMLLPAALGPVAFNPFYYRSARPTWNRWSEEELSIAEKLLDGIPRGNPRVEVISPEGHDQIERIVHPPARLFVSRQTRLDATLYHEPQHHLSPLGNEFVAEELFGFLTGRPTAPRVIRLLALAERSSAPAPRAPARPLSEYAGCSVGVGGAPLAGFVDGSERVDPISLGARSLLMIPAQDPEFLALPDALQDGEPVSLGVTEEGRTRDIPLGRLRSDGIVSRIAWASRRIPSSRLKVEVPENGAIEHLELRSSKDVRSVSVKVSGRELLRNDGFRPGERHVFLPTRGRLLRLRALPEQPPLSSLPPTGTLSLILRDKAGGASAIPLLGYAVRPVSAP